MKEARASRSQRSAAHHDVSTVPARARPRGGPAAAPEREHRRLLARGHRRAARARARGHRLVSRLSRAHGCLRAASRSGRGRVRAHQRARRRIAGGGHGVPPARPVGRPNREAIIVEPAFGMYADCVEATGGRVVTVLPRPDFVFPFEETLAAITPATRLVFLTSPGNPTGVLISHEAVRAVAAALPADAILFLDEAYADFTSQHFLDQLTSAPNVVVGRTFAKAYGLAALRIGAVVGDPAVIARLRRSLPPYSINVAAATALVAALGDRPYLEWYRAQVERVARAGLRRVRPSRPRLLAERGELRAGPRRRSKRRHRRSPALRDGSSCAIGRRSPAAPAAFASRPASSRTPRRACGPWRRCCAPCGDRSTDDGNAGSC